MTIDYEKEKEDAIEISYYDFEYSDELYCHILKSTKEPLNGKYCFSVIEEIRYYKNGQFHREDNLPAIIYKNGSLYYYVNGKSHRTNGPAEVYPSGYYYWWINGYRIDNEIMDKWLEENNMPLDWNLWSESDKNKFATYWTKKYGSPASIEEEVSDLVKSLTEEKVKIEKEMEIIQKRLDAINILISN